MESKKILNLFILLLLSISIKSYCQLTIDAGNDTTFCAGPCFSDTIYIGENVKVNNGVSPYTYSWKCKVPLGQNSFLTETSILNDTKAISPFIVEGLFADSIRFFLTVTDNEGNVGTDSIVVHLHKHEFGYYDDYQVVYINKGDSVWLNGAINEEKVDTAYWTPNEGLINPDSLTTWCKPDTTTDYYFTIVDKFGCSCTNLKYNIRVFDPNGINIKYYSQNNMDTKQSGRMINFRNSFNKNVFVFIFSLDGKLLYQCTTFGNSLEVGSILPKGSIYIVKTSMENKIGFCKFLNF